MNRIKLAIIGTKGIPANYGGFETCVDETSRILTKRGLDITVYCRNVLFKEKIQDYYGINLKYIGNINTKNFYKKLDFLHEQPTTSNRWPATFCLDHTNAYRAGNRPSVERKPNSD